jgi:hypothetical protein
MYAYGYRNMHHAKQTLELTGESAVLCENCDECTVNCSAGFDVRNRIHDIARLRDVPGDFLMA